MAAPHRAWLRLTAARVRLPPCSPVSSFCTLPADAVWPTTVGFPVEGFIKTHHPPAGQRLWLRALSAATVLVTLAAVVGSVQQVVASWQTFGVFKGGETGR